MASAPDPPKATTAPGPLEATTAPGPHKAATAPGPPAPVVVQIPYQCPPCSAVENNIIKACHLNAVGEIASLWHANQKIIINEQVELIFQNHCDAFFRDNNAQPIRFPFPSVDYVRMQYPEFGNHIQHQEVRTEITNDKPQHYTTILPPDNKKKNYHINTSQVPGRSFLDIKSQLANTIARLTPPTAKDNFKVKDSTLNEPHRNDNIHERDSTNSIPDEDSSTIKKPVPKPRRSISPITAPQAKSPEPPASQPPPPSESPTTPSIPPAPLGEPSKPLTPHTETPASHPVTIGPPIESLDSSRINNTFTVIKDSVDVALPESHSLNSSDSSESSATSETSIASRTRSRTTNSPHSSDLFPGSTLDTLAIDQNNRNLMSMLESHGSHFPTPQNFEHPPSRREDHSMSDDEVDSQYGHVVEVPLGKPYDMGSVDVSDLVNDFTQNTNISSGSLPNLNPNDEITNQDQNQSNDNLKLRISPSQEDSEIFISPIEQQCEEPHLPNQDNSAIIQETPPSINNSDDTSVVSGTAQSSLPDLAPHTNIADTNYHTHMSPNEPPVHLKPLYDPQASSTPTSTLGTPPSFRIPRSHSASTYVSPSLSCSSAASHRSRSVHSVHYDPSDPSTFQSTLDSLSFNLTQSQSSPHNSIAPGNTKMMAVTPLTPSGDIDMTSPTLVAGAQGIYPVPTDVLIKHKSDNRPSRSHIKTQQTHSRRKTSIPKCRHPDKDSKKVTDPTKMSQSELLDSIRPLTLIACKRHQLRKHKKLTLAKINEAKDNGTISIPEENKIVLLETLTRRFHFQGDIEIIWVKKSPP